MYNNNGNAGIKKVKSTPAVWAMRVLLALVFAACSMGTVMQIYDSAPYGIFGMFSGGGLIALCVIVGVLYTAVKYLLFTFLLRAGYNSYSRAMNYMGEDTIDHNYFYAAVTVSWICAGALSAVLRVLSIFYTVQLMVIAEFLQLIFKLAAMAAALAILARKAGKENFSFLFNALAPLFAVGVLLL